MFNTLHNVDDRRNAWVFTCDRWADHGCYILLPVNPATMTISNQLRSAQESTKRGKIVYISRNLKNRSLFKPPEIQFTIPSGNITPMFSNEHIQAASQYAMLKKQPKLDSTPVSERIKGNVANLSDYSAIKPSNPSTMKDRTTGTYFGTVASQVKTNIPNLYNRTTPIGIQNLYAFMMLADEQRYYNDRPNKIHVHINSLLYPSLFLRCTFTESGLSWTESADDPGQFDLEFTLRVIGTSPSLGYGMLNQFFNLYAAALSETQKSSGIDRMRAVLGQSSSNVDFESTQQLRGRVRQNFGRFGNEPSR